MTYSRHLEYLERHYYWTRSSNWFPRQQYKHWKLHCTFWSYLRTHWLWGTSDCLWITCVPGSGRVPACSPGCSDYLLPRKERQTNTPFQSHLLKALPASSTDSSICSLWHQSNFLLSNKCYRIKIFFILLLLNSIVTFGFSILSINSICFLMFISLYLIPISLLLFKHIL